MNHAWEIFAGRLETSAPQHARSLRRTQRLLGRAIVTLIFAAGWGLAAGAGSLELALANLYKVPMVVALSTLVALPAILTTRYLLDLSAAPLDVLAALIQSLFRAGLVLLGFAPLLAVYAYTSQWFSPLLAQVSGGLALACGALSLAAQLLKLEGSRNRLVLLVLVSCVVLCLSLLQLIAIATPILPVPTVFGAGLDGVVAR